MLTDTWLRKNKGKNSEKEITKADRDGLHARIRNGKTTFIFRATPKGGKRFNMKIGDYPAWSLNEARTEAQKLRKQIEEGHDPRKLKKAQVQRNATAKTIDDLFTYWFDSYAKTNIKAADDYKRSYEIHIKPKLGDTVAEQVTVEKWAEELERVAQKSPHIADRLRSIFRQAYTRAIRKARIESKINPLMFFTQDDFVEDKEEGSRFLNDSEIALVFDLLNNGVAWNIKNRNMIELALFYGCRISELRLTERTHINFEDMTWTVPPENHKTGKKSKQSIIRPILPEMKYLWEELLDFSASKKWVFPKMKTKSECGIGPMMRPPTDLTAGLIKYCFKNRTDEAGKPLVLEHFSIHDLRRTARTNFSKWGTQEVRERMVGHRQRGQNDTYDKYHYTEEMIPIYKQWWHHLKALENPDNKVVPIGVKVG